MIDMKTLTIDGNQYEIIDSSARNRITTLEGGTFSGGISAGGNISSSGNITATGDINANDATFTGELDANNFHSYTIQDSSLTGSITITAILNFLNNVAVFQTGTNIINLLNSNGNPRATIIVPYSTSSASASALCITMNNASTEVWFWKPINGAWQLYWSSSVKNNSDLVIPSTVPVEITALTTGSPNSDNGGCYYYKIGTRVHAHIAAKGLTQGTWSTLYTMPAGYRPYSILAATTWAGYTNGIPIVCGGRITTTGAIQAMTQSINGLVIVDLEYDAFA